MIISKYLSRRIEYELIYSLRGAKHRVETIQFIFDETENESKD